MYGTHFAGNAPVFTTAHGICDMKELIELFAEKVGRHPRGNVQDELRSWASEEIADLRQQLTTVQAENEAMRAANRDSVAWEKACKADLDRALARVAELTEMFAQGFDADGDFDEWRERAMKSIAGGLPSGNAFIKRQQAYAIEDWLHGDADMGDLGDYAARLRQQADELERQQ